VTALMYLSGRRSVREAGLDSPLTSPLRPPAQRGAGRLLFGTAAPGQDLLESRHPAPRRSLPRQAEGYAPRLGWAAAEGRICVFFQARRGRGPSATRVSAAGVWKACSPRMLSGPARGWARQGFTPGGGIWKFWLRNSRWISSGSPGGPLPPRPPGTRSGSGSGRAAGRTIVKCGCRQGAWPGRGSGSQQFDQRNFLQLLHFRICPGHGNRRPVGLDGGEFQGTGSGG
jgi:hypothetical protein